VEVFLLCRLWSAVSLSSPFFFWTISCNKKPHWIRTLRARRKKFFFWMVLEGVFLLGLVLIWLTLWRRQRDVTKRRLTALFLLYLFFFFFFLYISTRRTFVSSSNFCFSCSPYNTFSSKFANNFIPIQSARISFVLFVCPSHLLESSSSSSSSSSVPSLVSLYPCFSLQSFLF
jgi:drug/metabolite transporter (DMT)-like permease